MKRRELLRAGAGWGGVLLGTGAIASDRYGAGRGYPSGWGAPGQVPRWEAYPDYRVGNYSGGFERMFPHRQIKAGAAVSPLRERPAEIRYVDGFMRKTPAGYLDAWPVTSLLIARDGDILFEAYRMAREPQMRMTSWSMAKSVTALLFGIAMDQGLIRSLDDLPEAYAPSLLGTLHGGVSLRHLLNMSSGADVVHDRDPVRIDVPSILGLPEARTVGTDTERTVRGWRDRREAPGLRFNYNELCPLTIGMVVRGASNMALAEPSLAAAWCGG
jgi:CubicO group peptidase (beta-lactamase class C family)